MKIWLERKKPVSDVIRIGVLEDDPDMQAYLTYVAEQADNLKLVFCEESVQAARQHIDVGLTPDLCLVDLQLPDGSGVDFIRHATSTSNTKCLVLTVLGDRTSVITALEAGANGYLLKDSTERMIIQSIEKTMTGANPISPEAATHLLSLLGTADSQQPADDHGLTAKETEILTFFAKGLSYKETAGVLEVSTHTVNDHVKSIYNKLSVHSKSEAIFEALQLGLIKI